MHKHHRGFTLIEIAIVVAVVAILTGITLVVYNNVQKQARDTKRQNDMRITISELKKFFDQNGEYPPRMTGTEQNPGLLAGARQTGSDFLVRLTGVGVQSPTTAASVAWGNRWLVGASIYTSFFNIPSQPNTASSPPDGYFFMSTGAGDGSSSFQASDVSGGCKFTWTSPMYVIGYWNETERTHKFYTSANVTVTTGAASSSIPTEVCVASTL